MGIRITREQFAGGIVTYLPGAVLAFAAALAAALTLQYIAAMATTSLWVDEYYSVLAYASEGPWVAWTNYSAPNNHILYNILNSIWPTDIAQEPTPARLFSFIATIVSFVMVGWFATRERAWGGGALALLLLANAQTLDLTLQARGYGFTMLAAIVQTIATARYLEDSGRGWLIAVAAAAFAGTATLPIFILLAAPLAIGLLALRPRREVLVVLGVTTLLGIGFYLPTAAQVIAAASTYAADWGTQYATVDAIRQTFLLVLPSGTTGLASVTTITVVIVAALVRGERHRRGFLVLTLASLVVFFAVCLAMTTPLIRTTQFAAAVLPVTIVAASGTAALGARQLALAGNALLLAVTVPLAVDGLGRLRDFTFTPIEAWREAAKVVEAIVPPDLPVHVTFRSGQFAVYLYDPARVVDTFDAEAFRRGDLVVVDGNFLEEVRFTGVDHAAGAIDVLVPQRRGRHQVVSLVPRRAPVSVHTHGSEVLEPTALGDGDPETVWTSPTARAMTLIPDEACDRIVLLGAGPEFADHVNIRIGPRGSRKDASSRVFRLHRLVVIDLHGVARGPLRVTTSEEAVPLALGEAWCTAPDAPSAAP